MNRMIKKISLAGGMLLAITLASSAQAAVAVSLEELLEQVKTGRVADAAENQARLDQFRAARAQQAQMLSDMKEEQTRQEAASRRMEAQFEENDGKIITLEGVSQSADGKRVNHRSERRFVAEDRLEWTWTEQGAWSWDKVVIKGLSRRQR